MIYEARATVEPDWFPPIEDVARARARMERLGITHRLRRGWQPRAVEPGETPWVWWAGAALWVLVWPLAIAYKAAGHLDQVPWVWLAALPAIHMLALAIPVVVAYVAAQPSLLRRRFARVHTLAQILALEPEEFEIWSGLLFQLMGYRVLNTPDQADHGIDLEVIGPDARLGLVQCKRYRGTVGEPVVRDLYGTMMAAGADKAWLLTSGAFSRQAREWATGKPLELWDGRDLVALSQKYR